MGVNRIYLGYCCHNLPAIFQDLYHLRFFKNRSSRGRKNHPYLFIELLIAKGLSGSKRVGPISLCLAHSLFPELGAYL